MWPNLTRKGIFSSRAHVDIDESVCCLAVDVAINCESNGISQRCIPSICKIKLKESVP